MQGSFSLIWADDVHLEQKHGPIFHPQMDHVSRQFHAIFVQQLKLFSVYVCAL